MIGYTMEVLTLGDVLNIPLTYGPEMFDRLISKATRASLEEIGELDAYASAALNIALQEQLTTGPKYSVNDAETGWDIQLTQPIAGYNEMFVKFPRRKDMYLPKADAGTFRGAREILARVCRIDGLPRTPRELDGLALGDVATIMELLQYRYHGRE